MEKPMTHFRQPQLPVSHIDSNSQTGGTQVLNDSYEAQMMVWLLMSPIRTIAVIMFALTIF